MKNGIYSIYDMKGQNFSPPMLSRSDEEAKRQVHSTVESSKETLLAKYPEDFSLYRLGSFTEENGQIEGEKMPELICHVRELIES